MTAQPEVSARVALLKPVAEMTPEEKDAAIKRLRAIRNAKGPNDPSLS